MQIIKKKYKNGLRNLNVLTQDTQAVTIMFLIAVGSRYENKDEKGLAHFVEHTIFKGTKKRPSSKQIGMEIESLGGSSNAFTSYDYTGYYIKVPAVNFLSSFEILSDMFKNSLFSAKEIEKERGVIIEEIRMYEDRPTSKVAQVWFQNFFQDNNLGENITGKIENIKTIKQSQFFEFINKHYYAENVLLVISGNVDEGQINKGIEKFCMDIPSYKQKSKDEVNKSNFEKFEFQETEKRKKNIEIEKQVEQAHIVLGGKGIKRDDESRFAFQVANAILASGFGSRLFQVIRDELGLAYYIYSKISAFEETGVFTIGLGVDKGRVDKAIEAVKEQLKQIKETNFTKKEFERAKNYLLGNLVTELETSDDIASFYGMQELLQTKQYSLQETKEKILHVSLEDISEITNQVFNEENYYTAILRNS